MSDELQKHLSRPVPAGVKDRIFARVEPVLEERRRPEATPSWFALPRFAWFGGAGLAAAGIAAILLLPRQPVPPIGEPALAHLQYEAEMLKNAELLLQLETLERWERMEKAKAGAWTGKKS